MRYRGDISCSHSFRRRWLHWGRLTLSSGLGHTHWFQIWGRSSCWHGRCSGWTSSCWHRHRHRHRRSIGLRSTCWHGWCSRWTSSFWHWHRHRHWRSVRLRCACRHRHGHGHRCSIRLRSTRWHWHRHRCSVGLRSTCRYWHGHRCCTSCLCQLLLLLIYFHFRTHAVGLQRAEGWQPQLCSISV
jgi:hypothetical protein